MEKIESITQASDSQLEIELFALSELYPTLNPDSERYTRARKQISYLVFELSQRLIDDGARVL